MRTAIANGVTYFDRAEWGANPVIRGGHLMDGAAEKTEVPIHHTVIVDTDATPDLWESATEVKQKMRELQVIRFDIEDVPYNAVGFLMANRDLIVCEGRGPDRSGAHTIGHNRKGYGFALEGDMEAPPNPNISLWVPKLNQFFGWVKRTQLPKLAFFFPHLNVAITICPGQAMVRIMNRLRFGEPEKEEEEEVKNIMIKAAGKDPVYMTDGIHKWHILTPRLVEQFHYMGVPLLIFPDNIIEAIPLAKDAGN